MYGTRFGLVGQVFYYGTSGGVQRDWLSKRVVHFVDKGRNDRVAGSIVDAFNCGTEIILDQGCTAFGFADLDI